MQIEENLLTQSFENIFSITCFFYTYYLPSMISSQVGYDAFHCRNHGLALSGCRQLLRRWDRGRRKNLRLPLSTLQEYQVGYNVVPGYADQQVLPDFKIGQRLTLNADGTFNGNANNTWNYNPPSLELKWDEATIEKVIV
jgi:hypothetical protein